MNEESKRLSEEREGGENPETENEKLPGQPAAEEEISDEALEEVAGGSRNIPWKEHVHV